MCFQQDYAKVSPSNPNPLQRPDALDAMKLCLHIELEHQHYLHSILLSTIREEIKLIINISSQIKIVLTSTFLDVGIETVEGKTKDGISSPQYPAFTDDDPTSTTRTESSLIIRSYN